MAPPGSPARPSESGRVSVLIPTLNRPGMLREAVASALAQTYADVEVHIGLDGATPEAKAAARSLEAAGRVLVHEFPENRGTFAVYEDLIRLSDSAYVVLFSDDDRMEPAFVVKGVDALRSGPADAAFSFAHIARWDGSRAQPDLDCGLVNLNAMVLPRRSLRTLVERHGACFEPPYRRFMADAVFLRRLEAVGPRVHVHEPLVLYRVHAGRQTAHDRVTFDQILDHIHVMNEIGQPFRARDVLRRFAWLASARTGISRVRLLGR